MIVLRGKSQIYKESPEMILEKKNETTQKILNNCIKGYFPDSNGIC